MQCLKRCLLAFLAVVFVMTALAAAGAYFVADWLDDPDAPQKAAAILVLGGGSSRALEAADLYRAGYAPKIYLSEPVRDPNAVQLEALGLHLPREEEMTRAALAARGVPADAVELFIKDALSTAQEAKAAASRFAGVPGTLIVVTSPPHIHRTRIIFRDALPGRSLVVVANHYEKFPHRWWHDQNAAREVVLEVAKTVFYLAGGRF